jgi:hypothetical protein
MPYHLKLRGVAREFCNSGMRSLHPHAEHVYHKIVTHIEGGTASGGLDLEKATIPLSSLLALFRNSTPAQLGLTAPQHAELRESMERMQHNGLWRFLIVKSPMVSPTATLIFYFGFDSQDLRDLPDPNEIWCDVFTAAKT